MIEKDKFYRHAIDKNGNLIHVSAVTEESRHDGYRCVCCNDELVPVLGKKNAHHFRHKTDACSYESYIHKIWKRRVQDNFYKSKSFKVSYFVATPCKETHSCQIKKHVPNAKCNVFYIQTIDLKQEYDTCVEEQVYMGYKGDLVLTNSKQVEKEPLFIEIAFTHNCEEAKIDTGIRIIELKVNDDENKPICLAESGDLKLRLNEGNPYNMKHLPNVRFYNFNRLPYPKVGLHSFVRSEKGNYVIYYSSNATCKTLPQHMDNSVMEIAIADEILYSRGDGYFIEAIMALGARNYYLVGDCRLCTYKIVNDIYHRKCPLMTEMGYDSALQCKKYQVRLSDAKRMSERLRGVPCDIWKQGEKCTLSTLLLKNR